MSVAGALLALGVLVTPASGADGAAERDNALRPAGPLQANWRVTRPGDPSDAAVMRIQILHDGTLIAGDYVLFQPFCGINLPPVRAGAAACEFDGVAADLTGQVLDGLVTVSFRPGPDGLEHRLIFPAGPPAGPLEGAYLAPGAEAAVPVRLSRSPD